MVRPLDLKKEKELDMFVQGAPDQPGDTTYDRWRAAAPDILVDVALAMEAGSPVLARHSVSEHLSRA